MMLSDVGDGVSSHPHLHESEPHLHESEDVSSEFTFFREKDHIVGCLQSIWIVDCVAFEREFSTMEDVLLKYLEQPHLICCHAEQLMIPINCRLLAILPHCNSQNDSTVSNEDGVDAPALTAMETLDRVCRVFHLLCRVVGFKYLSKYMPHEVGHMEDCIGLFTVCKDTSRPWQTVYVLLVWLSTLCMIPFDIHSMDSSNLVMSVAGQSSQTEIVSVIITLCTSRLNEAGPVREASAICLSSLLTRPDMEVVHLVRFVDWAMKILTGWTIEAKNDTDSPRKSSEDYFLLLGVLRTLVYIFKKGHRQKLLSVSDELLVACTNIFEGMEQTAASKLLTKLIQRIGMNYLEPKIAAWRYERGNRSLNLTLSANNVRDSVDAVEVITDIADHIAEEDAERVQETPPQIDEVIDCMLKALCNNDTVVRWSAAKAMGRISMRLSKSFAADIISAVHDLFSDEDADTNWHGGCLALAELSRRGLLLPNQLAGVMPLIEQAIFYDIMRGQHSIGVHVRDAACYVCWAFARAYSPSVMKPFIQVLHISLLTIAVFDREINCRRAASAAFQEMVGRQGADNVPHGIELITVVDYFSLSNRSHSFANLASSVVRIDTTLRKPFMQHLISRKIGHWDKEVRKLAARAYANLLVLGTGEEQIAEYMRLLTDVRTVTNDVNARHGLLLLLRDAAVNIAFHGIEFDATVCGEILRVLQFLEKSRIYRGRGGELMRIAMSSFIEGLAYICLPIPIKDQVSIIESLNDHIKQPYDAVQLAACNALRTCAFSFFQKNLETNPSDRLQALTVKKYISALRLDQNVAVTRGYACALGALPTRLTALPPGQLDEILMVLEESAAPSKMVMGEHDADTSCNSVTSCAELGEKMLSNAGFSRAHFDRVLSILFAACYDYSVDKRGDTGSWSRMAAMKGVERIIYAIERLKNNTSLPAEDLLQRGEFMSTARGLCSVESVQFFGCRSTVFEANYCGESFAKSLNELDRSRSTEMKSVLVVVDNKSLSEHRITTAMDNFLFTPNQVNAYLAILMEQLAGKLDAARDVAGGILSRLLKFSNISSSREVFALSLDNQCTLNSGMSEVLRAGELTCDHDVNWSDPDLVFPLIGQLLLGNFQFDSIISGLVVSVGGLSETTSMKATHCLLDFCEKVRYSDSARLEQLLSSILDLLRRHCKVDRVIMPAVKTINILIRDGVLDQLDTHKKFDFAFEVWEQLCLEMKGCRNVPKLCTIIDTMCLLLSFDPIRTRYIILLALLRLLLHRYPRVRKYCSDTFYLLILSDQSLVRPPTLNADGHDTINEVYIFDGNINAEKAQEILSSTAWETGTKDVLLRARMLLMEQLVLEEKDKVDLKNVKDTKTTTTSRKTDEHDSYEALVREAGY